MKDGDKLLEQLRQAAKRRDDIALVVFAPLYQLPWWYWQDFIRANKN